MRVDRALAHLGHEPLVGGVERLGPRAAHELRARVPGQVGEVLVAERDPAVQVEADGDQVDVLEELAEAALGLLEGAEPCAQVGLQLLVLERQAGGAADRLEELCVVGQRRVVDERRHPLPRPFDDGHGAVGPLCRVERPPVGVDVDVQVAEPVGQLEAGVADRLPQRPSHPARLVAARELVDQLGERARPGEARAQDPDQEADRDAREGQRRDDEGDRPGGVAGRDLDERAPRRSSRARRRSSRGPAPARAAPPPRPPASAGSRSRRRRRGARRRPAADRFDAADATIGVVRDQEDVPGRSRRRSRGRATSRRGQRRSAGSRACRRRRRDDHLRCPRLEPAARVREDRVNEHGVVVVETEQLTEREDVGVAWTSRASRRTTRPRPRRAAARSGSQAGGRGPRGPSR